MPLLTNRVAIVTGASKGIGRVMAQMFAHEGARVVCAARSDALVNETAATLQLAFEIHLGDEAMVLGIAAIFGPVARRRVQLLPGIQPVVAREQRTCEYDGRDF